MRLGGHRLLPVGAVDEVGAGQALELELAPVVERHRSLAVAVLGALLELLGDEDLAARAWAAIRAARITLRPKKSPSSRIASPACIPIRTRTRSPSTGSRSASSRWIAAAHSSARPGSGKTSMKPSPWFLTS